MLVYFIPMRVFWLSVYYFLWFTFFSHIIFKKFQFSFTFMSRYGSNSNEYAVKSFFSTQVPRQHPVSLPGSNQCFLFLLYSSRDVLWILSKYIYMSLSSLFYLNGSTLLCTLFFHSTIHFRDIFIQCIKWFLILLSQMHWMYRP